MTDIRIVDGGLPAWKAAKFPVTQEYFGNPKGTLPEKGHPEIALTVDDVLKRKPGAVLVDARPRNEYVGDDEPAQPAREYDARQRGGLARHGCGLAAGVLAESG